MCVGTCGHIYTVYVNTFFLYRYLLIRVIYTLYIIIFYTSACDLILSDGFMNIDRR